MDLFSLFLFTHKNNEIKSPTKIYDFTVSTNRSSHYNEIFETPKCDVNQWGIGWQKQVAAG